MIRSIRRISNRNMTIIPGPFEVINSHTILFVPTAYVLIILIYNNHNTFVFNFITNIVGGRSR